MCQGYLAIYSFIGKCCVLIENEAILLQTSDFAESRGSETLRSDLWAADRCNPAPGVFIFVFYDLENPQFMRVQEELRARNTVPPTDYIQQNRPKNSEHKVICHRFHRTFLRNSFFYEPFLMANYPLTKTGARRMPGIRENAGVSLLRSVSLPGQLLYRS